MRTTPKIRCLNNCRPVFSSSRYSVGKIPTLLGCPLPADLWAAAGLRTIRKRWRRTWFLSSVGAALGRDWEAFQNRGLKPLLRSNYIWLPKIRLRFQNGVVVLESQPLWQRKALPAADYHEPKVPVISS